MVSVVKMPFPRLLKTQSRRTRTQVSPVGVFFAANTALCLGGLSVGGGTVDDLSAGGGTVDGLSAGGGTVDGLSTARPCWFPGPGSGLYVMSVQSRKLYSRDSRITAADDDAVT